MPVDPESLRPKTSHRKFAENAEPMLFLCDLCVLGGEGLELRPHVTY